MITKKKEKKPKKMGRPRKVVNWDLVEKYCEIHCTVREIEHMTDCSDDALKRLCVQDNCMTFEEFYAKHSAGGRKSLRRAQFHKALEGSATMQIWLGKQWLNQSDKVIEGDDDDSGGFTLNYKED